MNQAMKSTYESMFGPLRWLLYLERVPSWAVLGFSVGLAAVVYLAWPEQDAAAAAGFCLAVVLIDWLSLALLPRTGRSFGPVKPPLISLAVVRAATMVVLGLVAPNHLWVALVVNLAITAVSLYALWVAPFQLGVTYQTLRSPKLDAGAPPLRLLHIGDLHVERISPRERALNRLVKELAPDIIVFSGDFVSLLHPDPDQARDHIRRIIEEWQAPLGVYVIGGSPLVETEAMVASYVEGLDNLRWLRDEMICINTPAGPVYLLGMATTHDRDVDVPRLRALTQVASNPSKDAFRLLLYHSPDLAPEVDELGYDLYLAGHTHGGQVRLPFVGALITSSEFWRTYAMGRYDMQNTTLYVTRGVGMEGASAPRIRLLAPPEIVLWKISGTGRAANGS
ncbi:MAG: metallophosphoesterase [Anaerolineae bacterium]|nr:metallophosphoesterase [Anaerolineae bacterium]